MTTLHKRALRTAIVVVVALHAANCPSVNSGPDTGCVRAGKPGGVNERSAIETIGRLFPELPKDSAIVLVRIDESESGVLPTAQYIDKYQPLPADPLSVLAQLGIDECQCLRADGQVCDTDAGPVSPPTLGTPTECEHIRVLGIDAHPPRNGFETCIFDRDCNVDADGGSLPDVDGLGERCVDRACTHPLILTYDPARQQYRAASGNIVVDGGLQKTNLTIELQPKSGSSAAGTCPTALATAKLKTVTHTLVTTPASDASVTREQDLVVSWTSGGEDSPAGFVIAIVRGARGGEERSVVCRGLDLAAQVTVQAAQLARLDPGPIELEVQRLNAVAIIAPPTQGGSILSVSTRKIPITLR